jgi:hypothetical protein
VSNRDIQERHKRETLFNVGGALRCGDSFSCLAASLSLFPEALSTPWKTGVEKQAFQGHFWKVS